MTPYPALNESTGHWIARCDAARADRATSRPWLSGRPTRSGTTIGEFPATVAGASVTAVRIGYGAKAAAGVKRYALRHGLGYHRYNGNGHSGKFSRTDAIAYRLP